MLLETARTPISTHRVLFWLLCALWLTLSACSGGGSGKSADNDSPKKSKGVKLSVKAKTGKSPWDPVTLRIKTEPKAKITVRIDEDEPRKAIKREVKADKKGKAEVVLPWLSKGSYEAQVSARHKKGKANKEVSFELDEGFDEAFEFKTIGDTDTALYKLSCTAYMEVTKKSKAAKGYKHPPYTNTRFEMAFADGSDSATLRLKFKHGQKLKFNNTDIDFKKGRAIFSMPLANAFKRFTVDGMLQEHTQHEVATVQVTFKGGRINGTIRCTQGNVPKTILHKVATAQELPGDPGAGGRSILLNTGTKRVAFNGGRPLASLDYIATVETRTRNLRDCLYKDSQTGGKINIPRSANDKVITVFNRRTGKKALSKQLKAKTPTCPIVILVGTDSIEESVKDEAVVAFIENTALQRLR